MSEENYSLCGVGLATEELSNYGRDDGQREKSEYSTSHDSANDVAEVMYPHDDTTQRHDAGDDNPDNGGRKARK